MSSPPPKPHTQSSGTHPGRVSRGYKAGVKVEKNLGIRGTEEWKADRMAKEAKKAKENELFKAAGERKVKEARRIEEAIETAHRDAVMFHREFDKSQGASEEELNENFWDGHELCRYGNVLEIHGPSCAIG
ncbi:uncharacterized protein EAF02_012083 [Botrytis sinoallii]|uniref:uncharacterized protein n=1 Tax=Botrytis sinoallii TaxID=1463999 RepID=UPI0019021887|nr:uncharacterized protein EAF02_012083 [Botrytis sinoallii]KAF7853140.1 hypothetical protein EAF02_012083 [Botrytis sinoallii]